MVISGVTIVQCQVQEIDIVTMHVYSSMPFFVTYVIHVTSTTAVIKIHFISFTFSGMNTWEAIAGSLWGADLSIAMVLAVLGHFFCSPVYLSEFFCLPGLSFSTLLLSA